MLKCCPRNGWSTSSPPAPPPSATGPSPRAAPARPSGWAFPGEGGGVGGAAGSGRRWRPWLCPQMAAAGFVHCPSENSPDVVQCFFCLKELEGWEPDDDPLWVVGRGRAGEGSGRRPEPLRTVRRCFFREEHKKHSAGCAFAALQKDPSNLTVQEFLKLDKKRTKNVIVRTPRQRGGAPCPALLPALAWRGPDTDWCSVRWQTVRFCFYLQKKAISQKETDIEDVAKGVRHAIENMGP